MWSTPQYCISDAGTYSELAAEVIAYRETYTEVSPSGEGIRLLKAHRISFCSVAGAVRFGCSVHQRAPVGRMMARRCRIFGSNSAANHCLRSRFEEMHAGMARDEATGYLASRSSHLGFMADAYTRVGQLEVSTALLNDALRTVEEANERFFESELYRLRGQVLLGMRRFEEAESAPHRAIAISNYQLARWWELRSCTSLARLWHDQGKFVEAGDLLASVCGWFTEGFDLADLKAAKALLEELRSKTS